MLITHITNNAIAAVLLMRDLEGSDADCAAVYLSLQVRYGLNQVKFKQSRGAAIRNLMVDRIAYLVQVFKDEKKARD